MMYSEFLDLTNSKVSFDTYTNKIEPQYMESPLSKQDFCKQYVDQAKKPRINKSNKFEYDGYTHCQTLKTAYSRLQKILANKGYPEAVQYDDDFINKISKGLDKCEYSSSNDEYQSSAIKWNQYEYYEYYMNKEDGTFFRITVENIDDDLWYIDCGFSIS